jgi:transposase
MGELTLTMRERQRVDVVTRWVAGAMTTEEAVGTLGCSERTAWRLRARLLGGGVGTMAHGNRGRPSPRRLPDAVRDRVVALASGDYAGINDSHLAELLEEREGIAVPRSTLRRVLREAGIASPRARRAPRHRSRRERMAQAGMLVQVDGSPHAWLGDRGPELTLVGGIDDATGVVTGATFRAGEDGIGYLRMLRDMCAGHGVPMALYRDRSGIFSPTRRALAEDPATQVGRALRELGIGQVLARSPQAKGRVERLWGTFQDRLVGELRLAGASDEVAANELLPEFVARFNRRFGVPAAIAEPAWRPVPEGVDLDRVCALRWRRMVGNDDTVRLEGAVLQLPGMRGRSLAGRRVEVQLRLDGRLLVVHDGHAMLAVPAPLDPKRLREVRVLATDGPAPASAPDRPGYPPVAGHPWRRPGPKAPSRALTDPPSSPTDRSTEQ